MWRIGESPLAPKFNIISKPNNWAKALQKSTSSTTQGKFTDLKMLQLEFWTNLNDFFEKNSTTVNTRTPRPQHWYDLSLGVGQKAYISLVVHNKDQYCSVEIYIPNSKELYFELEKNREKIESEAGIEFEWMELPKKQASRIIVKHLDFHYISILTVYLI